MTNAELSPVILLRSLFVGISLLIPATGRAEDSVEFLTGAKLTGTVVSIDKVKRTISFETLIAGRKLTRVYSYSRIHAVVLNGKRYELTAKTTSPDSSSPGKSPATTGSRATVLNMIKQAGETAPDWYDSTPLSYPKTLDLKWPQPPPKGWNNQKNVGQFIWDVINPNPGRWKQGVRFMHHMLTIHKNNAVMERRIMNELGRMYHDLLQDYARAAYWWQRLGVDRTDSYGRSGPQLAECYWRLGSRQMAIELLEKLSTSNKGNVLVNSIKLWCDLGELEKAERLAARLIPSYKRAGFSTGDIILHLGDGCRKAGKYAEAVRYYQQVLALRDNLKGKIKQQKDRARENIAAVKLIELSDVRSVANGTYRAQSLGYQGPIHVEVTVANRQITDVRVTRHVEKQFYSAISDTTSKIIKKNSVLGIDTTSSATITSEAIVNATAKALASGVK